MLVKTCELASSLSRRLFSVVVVVHLSVLVTRNVAHRLPRLLDEEAPPVGELDSLCHFLNRTTSSSNVFGWVADRSNYAQIALEGLVVCDTGG